MKLLKDWPMKTSATGMNVAIRNAANNGNLECLKYAHENGCPWNKMSDKKMLLKMGI